MGKKVAVALSGGVDSTMSALYLKEAGYDVEGLHFNIHNIDEQNKQSLFYVKKVASFLDIPFEIIDLKEEFRSTIYTHFIESYKKGDTPNPCALCNKSIKFGKVYEFIKQKGFDYLATGHYARSDGEFLYKGVDRRKDQSYFMYGIKKQILKDLLFPLGSKLKEDIKKDAMQIPLLKEIAEKKESSEICFVPTNYIDVLKNEIETDTPGTVVDEKGRDIGVHKGYMHYTIGKRKGFDVPLSHDKLYVKELDASKNQIVVSQKDGLYRKTIEVEVDNLFTTLDSLEYEVKIRYNTEPAKAYITIVDGVASIEFEESVFGVARGQIAAFYQGEQLLGGGVIR
ncbi:MAG: tRNA 2-thiouridine(34) synthase MnmA [Campylobacterales bacterium]